jgi:hypothetical protein
MPMRILVEIRKEDQELLEKAAWREHRSTREHAAYLLHLKIQELEHASQPASEIVVARAS